MGAGQKSKDEATSAEENEKKLEEEGEGEKRKERQRKKRTTKNVFLFLIFYYYSSSSASFPILFLFLSLPIHLHVSFLFPIFFLSLACNRLQLHHLLHPFLPISFTAPCHGCWESYNLSSSLLWGMGVSQFQHEFYPPYNTARSRFHVGIKTRPYVKGTTSSSNQS